MSSRNSSSCSPTRARRSLGLPSAIVLPLSGELPSAAVLPLSGEIDVANASAMVEYLCEHLVGPRRTIQVDLSEVTFMDSSGIGACLKAQRRARLAGYDIVFCNPSPPVTLVIEILGLEQVFSQGLAS